jgi:choline kinase
MRILILTVAGSSTRFSGSLGRETLKCLYYERDCKESLLYRMLHHSVEFDRYIIVGGYQFPLLQKAVKNWFPEYNGKISLVENPYYDTYGSGYSLYCGMKQAITFPFDEIVFAEGDLCVDDASYVSVFQSKKSVITCNSEPILSDKAVACYFDKKNVLHYIYDTNHHLLEIKEPFRAVYNSGQIWKFADKNAVRQAWEEMKADAWTGTNLVFVENYFHAIEQSDCEIIHFKYWINCNTVYDFNIMQGDYHYENNNGKTELAEE